MVPHSPDSACPPLLDKIEADLVAWREALMDALGPDAASRELR
jgi:hypothetical protein